MRHLIEGFWKETHLAAGYELVNSPHVAKTELWRVSGHYDFYKENMFDQMEVLRPCLSLSLYSASRSSTDTGPHLEATRICTFGQAGSDTGPDL